MLEDAVLEAQNAARPQSRESDSRAEGHSKNNPVYEDDAPAVPVAREEANMPGQLSAGLKLRILKFVDDLYNKFFESGQEPEPVPVSEIPLRPANLPEAPLSTDIAEHMKVHLGAASDEELAAKLTGPNAVSDLHLQKGVHNEVTLRRLVAQIFNRKIDSALLDDDARKNLFALINRLIERAADSIEGEQKLANFVNQPAWEILKNELPASEAEFLAQDLGALSRFQLAAKDVYGELISKSSVFGDLGFEGNLIAEHFKINLFKVEEDAAPVLIVPEVEGGTNLYLRHTGEGDGGHFDYAGINNNGAWDVRTHGDGNCMFYAIEQGLADSVSHDEGVSRNNRRVERAAAEDKVNEKVREFALNYFARSYDANNVYSQIVGPESVSEEEIQKGALRPINSENPHPLYHEIVKSKEKSLESLISNGPIIKGQKSSINEAFADLRDRITGYSYPESIPGAKANLLNILYKGLSDEGDRYALMLSNPGIDYGYTQQQLEENLNSRRKIDDGEFSYESHESKKDNIIEAYKAFMRLNEIRPDVNIEGKMLAEDLGFRLTVKEEGKAAYVLNPEGFWDVEIIKSNGIPPEFILSKVNGEPIPPSTMPGEKSLFYALAPAPLLKFAKEHGEGDENRFIKQWENAKQLHPMALPGFYRENHETFDAAALRKIKEELLPVATQELMEATQRREQSTAKINELILKVKTQIESNNTRIVSASDTYDQLKKEAENLVGENVADEERDIENQINILEESLLHNAALRAAEEKAKIENPNAFNLYTRATAQQKNSSSENAVQQEVRSDMNTLRKKNETVWATASAAQITANLALKQVKIAEEFYHTLLKESERLQNLYDDLLEKYRASNLIASDAIAPSSSPEMRVTEGLQVYIKLLHEGTIPHVLVEAFVDKTLAKAL